jgi:cyclin-dependent kinase 9
LLIKYYQIADFIVIQIALISQLCGTIDTTVWPNVEKLDLFTKINLPQGQKRRVIERMQPYVKDQYALDLLDHLLTLDPKQRYNSDEALYHNFFWTDPLPSPLKLDRYIKSMYEFIAPPRNSHLQMKPVAPKHIMSEQHYMIEFIKLMVFFSFHFLP